MNEIVNLHVGQCGSKIGAKFWEIICDEHGIDENGSYEGSNEEKQLNGIHVYFNEISSRRRYFPRSIFLDLEPYTLTSIISGPYGKLYDPENIIYGDDGSGGIWATGYKTYGNQYIDQSLDCVRNEVESCESFQGFQLTHSLSGGTGSGMCTLLIDRLKDLYPSRMIHTYSVFPSPTISDVVVEPYNSVMAIDKLIDKSDFVVCLDNEALTDICFRTLKIKPNFGDLNHLISLSMSGITSSMRFPGQLNCSLRRYAVNLIPFPRIHFFITGFAPLNQGNVNPFRTYSVEDITRQLFNVKNMMCSLDSLMVVMWEHP